MKLIYIRVGYNKEVQLYSYNDSLEVKPKILYIIETEHGNDMGYMEPSAIRIDIYEQFNQNRLKMEAKQADELDLQELKQLEEDVKSRN